MNPIRNKKIVIVAIVMLTTQSVFGQDWKFNEKESFVVFIAKNLGLKVSGKISGMTVAGKYVSENIFASSFVGSIDVSTIDTDIVMRDNHLKSNDYFDVKTYPTIIFKPKEISESGSSLKATGTLTIKGVTKETEIFFTVKKNGLKHTLEGNVTIQRKDFDLGSNTTLVLADTIQVRIFAVFERI